MGLVNKGEERSEEEQVQTESRTKEAEETDSEDVPKKSRGKGGKDVYPDGRENRKERKKVRHGFKACRAWK